MVEPSLKEEINDKFFSHLVNYNFLCNLLYCYAGLLVKSW